MCLFTSILIRNRLLLFPTEAKGHMDRVEWYNLINGSWIYWEDNKPLRHLDIQCPAFRLWLKSLLDRFCVLRIAWNVDDGYSHWNKSYNSKERLCSRSLVIVPHDTNLSLFWDSGLSPYLNSVHIMSVIGNPGSVLVWPFGKKCWLAHLGNGEKLKSSSGWIWTPESSSWRRAYLAFGQRGTLKHWRKN